MRLISLFLFALSISPAAADKTKSYRGAWFDISYPADFKIKPSLKNASIEGKYDSAFFIAPDAAVRFYIFSPQWSGETPDIAQREDEKLADEKTETENGFTRRYFTYRPQGNGLTRSYVETTNADKTVRWVVGIEYKDQKAYARYKSAYLKFKKSLRQYAD